MYYEKNSHKSFQAQISHFAVVRYTKIPLFEQEWIQLLNGLVEL